MPPLENKSGLKGFYQDHPLPADVDPAYKDVTVEKDVRVCDDEDTTSDKIVGYLDGQNTHVLFLAKEKVPEKSTFLDWDDSLYRRILSGTGGLRYKTEATAKDGAAIPIGTAILDMCRDEKPSSAPGSAMRYGVYETYNTILENHPDLPALREVDFEFREDEIIAIVKGLGMDRLHYGVDETDHRRLLVFPDLASVDGIIEFLKGPSSPIAADRRDAMVKAFEKAMAPEKKQMANQDEGLALQREGLAASKKAVEDSQKSIWAVTLVTSVPLFYLTMRQMGLTTGLEIAVGKTYQALKGSPGRLARGDWKGAAKLWSRITEVVSPIAVDMTEELKKVTLPLTDTAQAILDGFDRGEMPHNLVSGASGSGKGHATKAAGAAIVQGRSGVEAFEGASPRYVRISASRVVMQAGSWLNRAEELFFKSLDRYTDALTVIHLTEADGFAKAGMGSGNEPLNLLAKLYEILESAESKYRNLHFILDSTRWEVIEKAAPDILRRTAFIETRPPLPQELRKALDEAVASRRSGAEGKIPQKRYGLVSFDPAALDAIAALGDFERGAPPSAHITVMNNIVAEALRKSKGAAGPIEIKQADVVAYVARATKQNESDVQAALIGLLADGIENNVKIQDRIVDAYYRAYPNPKEGKINPLKAINPLAASAGSKRPAKAAPVFTEENFEDLFKAKFRQIELTVDPGVIKKLATRAYEEWNDQGRPMDAVDGHRFPSEGILEDVLERAAASVPTQSLKDSFSRALRQDEERKSGGESLADNLPAGLKDIAREAFKTGEGK